MLDGVDCSLTVIRRQAESRHLAIVVKGIAQIDVRRPITVGFTSNLFAVARVVMLSPL